ncbi:uncharacterized protein LOC108875206 [Lates calcarifer]|uniref:Uncharacterized protein LOC108875206 n=1 Tax=Lates calcarifer TaxID=8187 RepID=A0AAJ7LE40_LATCA|nr:uncharacterized protein LOC108875206 [Lates calcarifer]XP_018519479.1 uncharacterized protein LOC108875206 [Lates calcarifer]
MQRLKLTAMDLPFGVSWLCTLLLWGCICFPSQRGYNIAHGYSLNENPQTSNQFHSGAFLNTNHEDETKAMREPVHENREDVSSVTSLGEEMVQNKPDSGQDQDESAMVPSAPSEQKYKHLTSGNQHPFGILLKEHTPQKTVEGVSFPTIDHFIQFIETMKSSFLTPGSDLSVHFQTARETLKNELTSGAQNNGESSTTSDSVKDTSAHDNSENEVWSEPTNTVFEQSEPDTNYQKPSESLFSPDPFNSTASLISPSVYDNQDSGPSPALYLHHDLATTEQVSSNYGSLAMGGISGENPDIFSSAPNAQKEDVQSTSNKLPEKIPSGSFFGGDFSLKSHVTASPVHPQNSPSQDLSFYSSKTSSIKPLTSEKNIQKPKYSSHSGDSSMGHQNPSGGFELGKDFHREEIRRVTQADVSAPRGQLYIPDNLPKHGQRPAQTVQTESKDINYTPIIHMPVSTGSVSSNSDLSPQSSSGHVNVESSSPHDPHNQVYSRKQPIRFHLMFTARPSSSPHDSSRHDEYLGNQRVSISRPSVLTVQAKDEEKSDLSKQTASQEPKQANDNTLIPISSDLNSTKSGILTQVSDAYARFNSTNNLDPTSQLKKALSRLFGNEVTSRNFEIKNIISDRFPHGDIHGARNLLGSFSTQQRQGISLNDGFLSATKAGLQQTFKQLTKVQKHPANVNEEPGNMAYWPPKLLSASKVSGSTLGGVFWRNHGNKKKIPPQMGPNASQPPVNVYIMKSRNGYVRGKESQSKTHYTPYHYVEDKTAKDQWKPVSRKQKALLYPTV